MASLTAAVRESAGQLSEVKLLQLPLRELGLKYVPAIPVDIGGMADTVPRLVLRIKQREQALQGLSRTFTIGGKTARAFNFLYGNGEADKRAAAARGASQAFLARDPSEIVAGLVQQLRQPHDELALIAVGGGDPLTKLALDDPRQYSIGWTTFPDVYSAGLPLLEEWAATLDVAQPDKATAAFFPTIARYGPTFNGILLRKIQSSDVGEWRDLFGEAWTPALDAAARAGLLYVIDLRIYETLEPQAVAGIPRFTPSTVTVLVQDQATKALTPELVRVAGGDNEPKVFSRQDSTTASAWVYALQAAKASVTVFGIWLGHVYQWHIVTAAMVMTMFENLSAGHPVRRLLEPQSNFLIPFDDVLLLSWSLVAPPTSIATGWQFLELMDLYAKGREFFDDDPTTTLDRFGVTEADFTSQEAWDQYPIVGQLLSIWSATGRYVSTCVDQAYRTDQDVQRDQELQNWIAESGNENGGNVRGLPAMDSKDSLKRVLHSLIYRITAHGTGRLYRGSNPAIAFVGNFPPCLHGATIPDPTARFDTRALLRFLPRTGTIGSMLHFTFTFWASTPYVPLVPIGGPDTDLFFDDDASNGALIEFRRFIAGFVERFEPEMPQIWQWPRNIET
jgi:Lipoxygenase